MSAVTVDFSPVLNWQLLPCDPYQCLLCGELIGILFLRRFLFSYNMVPAHSFRKVTQILILMLVCFPFFLSSELDTSESLENGAWLGIFGFFGWRFYEIDYRSQPLLVPEPEIARRLKIIRGRVPPFKGIGVPVLTEEEPEQSPPKTERQKVKKGPPVGAAGGGTGTKDSRRRRYDGRQRRPPDEAKKQEGGDGVLPSRRQEEGLVSRAAEQPEVLKTIQTVEEQRIAMDLLTKRKSIPVDSVSRSGILEPGSGDKLEPEQQKALELEKKGDLETKSQYPEGNIRSFSTYPEHTWWEAIKDRPPINGKPAGNNGAVADQASSNRASRKGQPSVQVQGGTYSTSPATTATAEATATATTVEAQQKTAPSAPREPWKDKLSRWKKGRLKQETVQRPQSPVQVDPKRSKAERISSYKRMVLDRGH